MRKIFLSALAVLTLSACGTLFSGSSQMISIDSNVKGVEIYDAGMKLCETPCSVRLKRARGEKTLIAKKETYEDNRVLLGTSVNAIALLDVFFTYGFSTDLTTGSIWEYAPNNFYVNMMKDAKFSQRNEIREREIRRYILHNWDALRKEAQTSDNGEYLTGLIALTKLPKSIIISVIKTNVSPVLAIDPVMEELQYQ